jgi:ribonuclease J
MLRFIALSGTTSVTENLYIYETEDSMMIIDCGVGFPDLEMHGVDLVIPDFSYIIKNKWKLKGIVVSQGHEDHIGALPFLLKEIQSPIWAAPLVSEFLKDKFEDYGVSSFSINTFDPSDGGFNVGPFKVYPFRVTHSVPDTVGFAIDTPLGRVFHVPEHKMDQTPVDGMAFDIERVRKLSHERAIFLASDCLGANRPGYTPGELAIEDNMLPIVKSAKGCVFATAISSNIGRFQQMIRVARNTGRKVVFIGHSVQKKAEIANLLGYLDFMGIVIDPRQLEKFSRDRLFCIIAGCYGQVGSSVYRLAMGEHEKVWVEEGDTMIFSADPAPPYTKESEDFVIDHLIDKGVDVHYYDLDEGLYVSGHGSQEDILDLFRLVKPQNLIPIGGTIRFMHAYRKLATANGFSKDKVFILKPGESVEVDKSGVRRGKKVPTKEVLVHGLGVGDVGKVILGERAVLGNEGVVIAIIKVGKSGKVVDFPQILSRGFVFEKVGGELLREAERRLLRQLNKIKTSKRTSIEKATLDYLENFLFQKIGRRPMILPVIIEI